MGSEMCIRDRAMVLCCVLCAVCRVYDSNSNANSKSNSKQVASTCSFGSRLAVRAAMLLGFAGARLRPAILAFAGARARLRPAIVGFAIVGAVMSLAALESSVSALLARPQLARTQAVGVIGDDLGADFTLRETAAAEQALMETSTPHGSILQELEVERSDEPPLKFSITNPRAFFWLALQMSQAFSSFLSASLPGTLLSLIHI